MTQEEAEKYAESMMDRRLLYTPSEVKQLIINALLWQQEYVDE